MSSKNVGTPIPLSRKRIKDKETPPRERAGLTGTTKEIERHRIREDKKESGKFSVLKKNKTFSDFNKEFDEFEKQQIGEDFSDDDFGLIDYGNDDEEDLGLIDDEDLGLTDYGVDNTSFRSITDEKEKEEKERRRTLQEKHIKKEKTCTLEDCTITGGNKRRRRSKRKRSKRRKTNRNKTKKKRGKKAGGVSQRPPPGSPPNNELQRIVRNFSDTIFTIGARIGRNETIYNDEFESIVNVGRGQLNTALLQMFPMERQGDRRASIRFVTQLRDFVNLQMAPANMDQRLPHGQLVSALDDIIGFLSNREDRGREYVARIHND